MFKALYKSSLDPNGNQEERRKALLDKQKGERQNRQDEQRSLEDELLKPLEEESGKSSKFKSHYKQKNWQQRQDEKLMNIFRDIYGVDLALQQSEWLRDTPANICDWLLVPCPKGQRSMVVSYNKQTKVYNKLGRCICVFRSMLPGDGLEPGSLSILDCIYVREQNLFYVLDVITFGSSQNLLYCEAEYRFFWLRSKWSDLDHLEKRNEHNQKPFLLLKQYDFENMFSIGEAFQKYPLWPNNKPNLDGFLFYHRFAHYTCGTTPLVGWLFAFMVPEVLNMQVNEEYVKPEEYVDASSYMDAFDERLQEKWRRSRQREKHREERMDTSKESFKVESTKLKLPEENYEECKLNAFDLLDFDINPKSPMGKNYSESGEEDTLQNVLDAQKELEMLLE